MLIKLFDRDHSKTIDFAGFQQLFPFVNQWRTVFASYDRDNSHSIDGKELGMALQQMGYRLSQPTVDALISRFTSEKRGQINFDSFIIACIRLQQLTGECFFLLRISRRSLISSSMAQIAPSLRLIAKRDAHFKSNNRNSLTDSFRRHDKQQTGIVSMGYEDFVNAALSGT